MEIINAIARFQILLVLSIAVAVAGLDLQPRPCICSRPNQSVSGSRIFTLPILSRTGVKYVGGSFNICGSSGVFAGNWRPHLAGLAPGLRTCKLERMAGIILFHSEDGRHNAVTNPGQAALSRDGRTYSCGVRLDVAGLDVQLGFSQALPAAPLAKAGSTTGTGSIIRMTIASFWSCAARVSSPSSP